MLSLHKRTQNHIKRNQWRYGVTPCIQKYNNKDMNFNEKIALFTLLFPFAPIANPFDCKTEFEWLKTTFENNDAGFGNNKDTHSNLI